MLLWCITITFPTNALSDSVQSSGRFEESFNWDPVGYSLIGVGGVLSFISFGGLFAGGDSRDCAEEKTQEHYGASSEEICSAERAKANKQFYSTMAVTLGVGLVTAGAGIAIIKWDSGSQVAFELDQKGVPMIALNLHGF